MPDNNLSQGAVVGPDCRSEARKTSRPTEIAADRWYFLQAVAIVSAGAALAIRDRAQAADTDSGESAESLPIATPAAAIAALLAGNRRFVAGRMTSCQVPLGKLLKETVEKQEPFAAVLSCADSRVPVEMVFDQELGKLFVVRVAGNIATPEIIASLEYGVAVLGTKLILVMGHGNCGAVKATISAKPVPGQISSLYQFIQPAVQRAGHHLDSAIRDNARIQAALLAQSSPVLAKAIADGKLQIAPAYYNLANGTVTLLKA